MMTKEIRSAFWFLIGVVIALVFVVMYANQIDAAPCFPGMNCPAPQPICTPNQWPC